MTRKQLIALRRYVFSKQFQEGIRARREWCRRHGYCLRCLVRHAVKWKRCPECLAQHSKRKTPHAAKKGGKK